MRHIFIGDIHGCSVELQELIDKIDLKEGDHLFSTGDVINKGPDSIACLEILAKYNAATVMGNHEAYFLKLWHTQTNFSHPFFKQFQGKSNEVLNTIQSWPLYRETDKFLLVHAGLEPGIQNLDNMSPKVLMNIRTWNCHKKCIGLPEDPPWHAFFNPKKPVIFGHWAVKGLQDLPFFKGLDTGCVYGGQLTAYCLEENRFYQVESKQPKMF